MGSVVPIGSRIGCHCVGSKTKRNVEFLRLLELSPGILLGCRLLSIYGIAFRVGSGILDDFKIDFAEEGRLIWCFGVVC